MSLIGPTQDSFLGISRHSEMDPINLAPATHSASAFLLLLPNRIGREAKSEAKVWGFFS